MQHIANSYESLWVGRDYNHIYEKVNNLLSRYISQLLESSTNIKLPRRGRWKIHSCRTIYF